MLYGHILSQYISIEISLIGFDLSIYLFYTSQITALIEKKALIKIFTKYLDFTNIVFFKLVFKFFQYTKINSYTIKLING